MGFKGNFSGIQAVSREIYADTMDGPAKICTNWKRWCIPWFIGFQPRWCRISQPSTVCESTRGSTLHFSHGLSYGFPIYEPFSYGKPWPSKTGFGKCPNVSHHPTTGEISSVSHLQQIQGVTCDVKPPTIGTSIPTPVIVCYWYIYIYIWRFPEIGLPLNHPF